MPDRTSELRRSPMPPREIPLERGTRTLRSSGPTKAKHPTVTREERSAKKTVRVRSGGLCELRVPGVCLGTYREWSHRWAEGQGGLWLPSNGLASCGWAGCHGWLHRNPEKAKALGWIVPPTYRIEHGRRVPVPTSEFPAEIWLPGFTAPCRVLLDDEGGWTAVDLWEAS